MQHTTHYITITNRIGKTALAPQVAPVVYLQPRETRLQEQTAIVHIVCSEWLDPYWYSAIYSTGDHSFSGKYMPHAYELVEDGYKFIGTFEQAMHQ